MASLLEKINTLVSADLNRLVDGALHSNEPAIFQQHIRELQVMQEQLTAQLLDLRAQITAMRRRADAKQAVVVQQDAEVDQLLQAGLQEDALAAQERLNQSRLAAGRAAEKVDRLEGEYARLAETKAQLDARIMALRESEPEVEGLASAKRAKDLADKTDRSLEDLAGAGDADVDRVVGSIRRRLDAAELQLTELEKRALGQGETPEVLKRKELEDQLAARKARLGLAEPAVAPAPAPEPATPGPEPVEGPPSSAA